MLLERAYRLTLESRSFIYACNHARTFVNTLSLNKKPLPPRPKLADDQISSKFLKGSGPGGQKINKTNSAVQITHLPTGTVVKSQSTRSRSQNSKIAREILAEKIELLQKGDKSRAAKKIELKSRRKATAAKKSRRKYRKLEQSKNTGEQLALVEFEEAENAEEDSGDDGKKRDVPENRM